MQLHTAAQRQAGRTASSDGTDAQGFTTQLAEMIAALPAETARPLLDELVTASWADPALIARSGDHARLIAARPDLGPAVIDALITEGVVPAVITLLNNPRLKLNGAQFKALAQRARSEIALRAPLTRHPRLTREAAALMLDVVGANLREALTARFADLHARRFNSVAPQDASQALHRLQQGDFLAFRQGLSRLTGLDIALIDRALSQDSAVPLVLLLTAAGIDRAAFPDILTRVQALNDGHPFIHDRHLSFVRGLFDLTTAESRQRLVAIYASS